MAGWYHQCNELELGQTLGDDEGQGGPACFSSWGHKESDVTGRQNNNSHSSDMSQKGAHACLVCFSETDESLSGHPSTVLAAALQRVVQRDQTSDVSVYALAAYLLSSLQSGRKNQEDADGDKSDFFFSKIQVQHEYSMVVKNMGFVIRV